MTRKEQINYEDKNIQLLIKEYSILLADISAAYEKRIDILEHENVVLKSNRINVKIFVKKILFFTKYILACIGVLDRLQKTRFYKKIKKYAYALSGR